MKKILTVVLLTSLLMLCACSNNENTADKEQAAGDYTLSMGSDGTLHYQFGEESARESSSDSVIKRTDDKIEPSAPEKSISYEEACQKIDACSAAALNLPMSASEYQKYYLSTVQEGDRDYYSVYLYLDNDRDRLYVGSNLLVACDGSGIKIKTWTSDYLDVDTKTTRAVDDKPYTEVYAGAKISPNEALLQLAKKGDKLGLERNLRDYTFEVNPKIATVDNTEYYKIAPKLEYKNSISIQSPYYVALSGNGTVLTGTEDTGYTEVK